MKPNQNKSIEKLTSYEIKKGREDYIFKDINMKQSDLNNVTDKKDGKIRGNYRLKSGMFRTPKQQETYIEESLERELP